jgi:hypothetical protein
LSLVKHFTVNFSYNYLCDHLYFVAGHFAAGYFIVGSFHHGVISSRVISSEVWLFSRKHKRPPIPIRIGSHALPQTTTFKYLGVFFDCGLRWSTQTNYVKQRCLQRINLLKSLVGVSWAAHPSCMLLLYRGSLALFWNTVTQKCSRHTR